MVPTIRVRVRVRVNNLPIFYISLILSSVLLLVVVKGLIGMPPS